jgi:hypothetical protein
MIECECGKQIECEDSYRCRICDIHYCKHCSMDHFGLYEDHSGHVKYKNIFKTMIWLVRKRIFGK